jgi:hypothetical protein
LAVAHATMDHHARNYHWISLHKVTRNQWSFFFNPLNAWP